MGKIIDTCSKPIHSYHDQLQRNKNKTVNTFNKDYITQTTTYLFGKESTQIYMKLLTAGKEQLQ